MSITPEAARAQVQKALTEWRTHHDRVAGDNLAVAVEAMLGVAEPPTTDDREALAAILRDRRIWNGSATDMEDAGVILAAGFRRPSPPTEEQWEYGWRAFFDNGEEYEWLACSSLEEARFQAAEYQKEEERVTDGGHLTYSVWKRRVAKPGPWEPVEAAARVGGGNG